MRQVFDAVIGTAYDSLIGNMKLGDIYIDNTSGKQYKLVQYSVGTGTIAAVAGNAVGYTAAGILVNSVTSDVSDTIGMLAGVLTCAATNGQYVWIQIQGLCTLTTAFVSGAAGNAMILSATTDGTLKVGAAVTDAVGAICIDAANKIVQLRCGW